MLKSGKIENIFKNESQLWFVDKELPVIKSP